MTAARQMGIEASGVRPRILYVEDNAINAKVVKYGLRSYFDVIVAVDARQACDEVRAHHRDLAAILMDIELQGSALDGLELTRLFRGDVLADGLPDYARDLPILETPIIIVTAFVERYASDTFAQTGADYHMPKPVNLRTLRDLVARGIQR